MREGRVTANEKREYRTYLPGNTFRRLVYDNDRSAKWWKD